MAQIKFISGDGVEHEVEETSMAAEIMRQNGFQVIKEPETTKPQGLQGGAPAPVPAPMKRPEIIARAKELGLTFKSNEKNAVLLEMIAAKDAEIAAAEAEDEDGE